VTFLQLTEKLQRRVFGPPADSAYSHVGIFVLKTKNILWRNCKNVKDVNMVDVKMKVKVILKQNTKAQRRRRVIALLFL
jgi:hypothetical protein